MADVKWIKIVTDIFDNRKIKQIEKLPEADAIINIWFRILCLAGTVNEGGKLLLTKEVPYTNEMLVNEFNKTIEVIRLALNVLVKFNMIEIIDNIYCISNWQKYQNIDGLEKIKEQNRLRVAKHRSKHKELDCNVTVMLPVTQSNDIDIDKELDIKNKKKNIYGEFENVKLSEEEYNKLITKYNEKDILSKIEDLSIYITNNPKKYKDHYATMLNWIRRDNIKEKPKKEEIYQPR
jgi:predicted phage replisome organizer